MRVSIVDYGAGNLDSVSKAFTFLGAEPEIVRTPEAIAASDRLILPGVGAAGAAMKRLRKGGLDEALTTAVRHRGVPMLGICLGMQLLAERLHEHETVLGLGWLPGDVNRIDGGSAHLRVPHMGWSGVRSKPAAERFFAETRGKREFYFAHSYTLVTDAAAVAATVDYGADLTAAVLSGNVFAVQFHPEKSQKNGQAFLQAFMDWNP
jgi:glutamine amidotransferase